MVTLRQIDLGARPSKVWIGGEGEAILLVHGGWGGAEMHWARVWEPLAKRFRVIAPELPGIGDHGQPGLPSLDAYADWLVQLLDALRVPGAWCVGNSFGAAVVWQLADRLGARCSGVVIVNGMAPPEVPYLARLVLSTPPVWQLITRLYRKLAFAPAIVERAYFDPSLVPAELTRVLADPPRAQLKLLLGLILRGARTAPSPSAPVLVLWGESDRLPGTGPDRARKVQESAPGAKLVFFGSAGHCPQMERPAEFVQAIEAFVASASAAPTTSRSI
jgi:2-hydroxy-6-oxonona-2,4-dienedioate hydrolase